MNKTIAVIIAMFIVITSCFVFKRDYNIYGNIFSDSGNIYYANKKGNICFYNTFTHRFDYHKYKIDESETILDVCNEKLLIKNVDGVLFIKDLRGKSEYDLPNLYAEKAALTSKYIFFANSNDGDTIYRYNLLDEVVEKVCDNAADTIRADETTVYYSNKDDNCYLYKINTDTKEQQLLIPVRYTVWFKICDRTVFYSNYDDEQKIYSYDISSGRNCLVGESCLNFDVVDATIYYEQYYVDGELYHGKRNRKLREM